MELQITNIYEAVKAHAKISEPADMDTLAVLASGLNTALFQLAKEGKIKSFLIFKKFVVDNDMMSAIATGTGISLPLDFLRIQRMTYKSGIYEWSISDIDGRIPPAPLPGKATNYAIKTGADAVNGAIAGDSAHSFVIFPAGGAALADEIRADYWQAPPWRSALEWQIPGASVITDRQGGEVAEEWIGKAVAWIFNYQNKLQQAQALPVTPTPNANQAAS
jgi:hypothetical protein